MLCLAALLCLPAAAGLCEEGSWLITLENGSILRANSVGFTEDKVLVLYKLGDAEIGISRVCYVTHSGDSADILQQKGEHLSRPADKSAAERYSDVRRNMAQEEKTPDKSSPWMRAGKPGGMKAAYTAHVPGGKRYEPRHGGSLDRITDESARPAETADYEPVSDEEQAEMEDGLGDFYKEVFSGPGKAN